MTVWRVQPVVEVCTAIDYRVWRKARERAWKCDGSRYSVRTWPDQISEGELAAALLMRSHGGHWRGQPAEMAVPTLAHGVPARGHDVEHAYGPFALALLVGWMKLALADERQAGLLAPPLIDVIGRVPKPRVPRDLGIKWPLEPSDPCAGLACRRTHSGSPRAPPAGLACRYSQAIGGWHMVIV